MEFKVSEIFHSVQGEGLFQGIPSTFIRLSGCNLRCIWCDTPYASWNPEGETMSVDRILEQIGMASHVVLTGGEPLMFSAIVSLCEQLKYLGKVITIETAGTFFHDLSCDLMSISPKLAHSTPLSDPRWAVIHERERWKPKIVRKLMDTYIYQLKFVVSGTNDMHEIELLLSELGHVDPERVLIMPEGRSAKKIWRTARAILPEVMKRGWRLTPRIQIDLFGDIRGT